MSKDKCCCSNQDSKSSGFIFGVILGAIIGAIIAIYIYKHQKDEVIIELKKKITDFIDGIKNNYGSDINIKDNNTKTKTNLNIKKEIEPLPIIEDEFASISKIKKPKTFVRPKK